MAAIGSILLGLIVCHPPHYSLFFLLNLVMNDGLLWYMGGPGPGTSTSTRMGMVLGAYGSRWQREYWSSAFVGCAVSESGGGEVG